MSARSALGRSIVPALFAIAAAGTGARAATSISDAVAQPSTRAWLVAVYGLLRTCVALTFAIFTVGRSAPLLRSRDPRAFLACVAAMASVLGFGDPGRTTPEGLVVGGER